MNQPPIDDLLRLIAKGTAGVTGEAFFQSLVRHMSQALDMRYAFIAVFADRKKPRPYLAFWDSERFWDNFEYELQGTPCEAVLAGETRCYPKNVEKLFPLDAGLNQLSVKQLSIFSTFSISKTGGASAARA